MAAAFAGLFVATPASADVNTDANALFVRAVQAWTAAAAIAADDPAGAAERSGLLETVNHNLDQIITDLPGSDLAVRLITGETLGPITLQGARDALAQNSAAAPGLDCAAAPNSGCLLQEALADMAMIEDPTLQRFGFPEALRAFTAMDDTQAAITLMQTYPLLDTPRNQAEVARTFARMGEMDAAFAIVAATPDPVQQSYIRARIVQGLVDRGDDRDAFSAFSQVTEPLDRLVAMAALKEFEATHGLIDAMPADVQNSARKLLSIAAAQAGQIDLAQSVLDQITDSDLRGVVIEEIAMAQARAGLVAEALITAHRIPDPARVRTILAL